MTDKMGGDWLGIRPYGETVKVVTEAAVSGANAFLSRICLPAAEEFGLLLKDKVSSWRCANALKIVQKSEHKLSAATSGLHAHPRIVTAVIEHGSWAQEDPIQDMWAGLLASACTSDGGDDGNLIFVNILSQLTSAEVKILNFACVDATKKTSFAGWLTAENFLVSIEKLENVSGVHDFQRLDRELDHMVSLDLIAGGFPPNSTHVNMKPRSLALQMYVRCQGYRGSPIDFFQIESKEKAQERFKALPVTDITAEVIYSAFKASKLTLSQSEKFSNKHIGQKICWRGHIVSLRENGALISVTINAGGAAIPYVGVNFEVDSTQFPLILSLQTDKAITVMGVIESIDLFIALQYVETISAS